MECIAEKNLNNYPGNASAEDIFLYQGAIKAVISDAESGPEASYRIKQIRNRLFNEEETDYSGIKRYYNRLMMDNTDKIHRRIEASPDRIKMAVQYALTGNYIDFAALNSVTEKKLMDLLEKADTVVIQDEVYRQFLSELKKAKTLTYITDNCGEIVLDKLLIQEILYLNGNLSVTVIVRGAPAANDATMEDAVQIGMEETAAVIGNGTPYAGTVLKEISDCSSAHVLHDDVIISKGQANHETLTGCGLNIFYLFMCKCRLFTERYHVPQYGGVMLWEKR